MAQPVHVHGLRELQAAFRLADREEAKLLRRALRETATPVQQLAQSNALGRITNMTTPWSAMRVGQAKNVVYIVPRSKGTRGRGRRGRRNLKTLLLDRALIPALDARKNDVVQAVERMLAAVGAKWERA